MEPPVGIEPTTYLSRNGRRGSERGVNLHGVPALGEREGDRRTLARCGGRLLGWFPRRAR
jgi:hypothetical protein